jgi:spore photoproduct lyase
MGHHKTPQLILNEITILIKKFFPKLGINKKNEVLRLVYEISKREKRSAESVLESVQEKNFTQIKTSLIKQRYPSSVGSFLEKDLYLPPIDLDEKNRVNLNLPSYYPKQLFQ